MATVAAVQMTSGPEPAANLQVAARLIAEAAGQGAGLVLLPECFAAMGTSSLAAIAEAEGVVVSDEAVELVARRAGGSMRDSQSMFDQLLAFGRDRVDVGGLMVNEIPSYRVDNMPYGGVKDSGLGIKEGVVEAMKVLSTVKSISLPW